MAALSGMTGFARAARGGDFGAITVEARSVNNKGLDIRLRLPAPLEQVETDIRGRIKTRFTRGSISLTLTMDRPDTAAGLQIDEALLRRLAETGRELIDQGLARPPSLDGLLALRGVIRADEAEQDAALDDEARTAALDALDDALDDLAAARLEEGAALAGMLVAHIDEIAALTEQAAVSAASRPAAMAERIKAKFNALLPQGLDPDRLAQEAAALAVRADVREELDRLAAHVAAARALVTGGSPAGRKLDFLSQEFNREANTLCAKAADRELTAIGLALKHAIDQLREQVQNVE